MYKRPSQPVTLPPLSHSFPDQPPAPLFSCSDPAPAPPLRLRSITVLASPRCALAPPGLSVRWRLRAAAPCGGSQCGAVRGARASLRRGIVYVPAGRHPLHFVHLAPPPRPPALPWVTLCRRPCCCSWPRGRGSARACASHAGFGSSGPSSRSSGRRSPPGWIALHPIFLHF